MNEHTIKLLEQCGAGCKMAVESMDQILEYVQDDELLKTICHFKKKHEKIGAEAGKLLEKACKSEKTPGILSAAFAWATTEMKLMIKDDNAQITKILMNGCNMGIQSISESLNKYDEAAKEAVHLSKTLVNTEEEFMKHLKQFL